MKDLQIHLEHTVLPIDINEEVVEYNRLTKRRRYVAFIGSAITLAGLGVSRTNKHLGQ